MTKKEERQKYLGSTSEGRSFGLHIQLSVFYFPELGKEEILIKCDELLPLCYLRALKESENRPFLFKSTPLRIAH